MFSLAMKRGFVAEGKFSRNKSLYDVVIASDIPFGSDLSLRIMIAFSPVQKYIISLRANKWMNRNGN